MFSLNNCLVLSVLVLSLASQNLYGFDGSSCASEPSTCCPCDIPCQVCCPVTDKAKKSMTYYSCKSEPMCLPDAKCRTRLEECVANCCPMLGNWWEALTGGVIREKRVLQKTVITKEVDVIKYEVR